MSTFVTIGVHLNARSKIERSDANFSGATRCVKLDDVSIFFDPEHVAPLVAAITGACVPSVEPTDWTSREYDREELALLIARAIGEAHGGGLAAFLSAKRAAVSVLDALIAEGVVRVRG